MKISLTFDAVRIGIGESYIARNTSLQTFVYILKALDIPNTVTGDDTVCIDDVSLLHNLRGKCYFRFIKREDGAQTFSKVKLVIDPALYPGLRDAAGKKRMSLLRDFVAVSLGDRLNAMAEKDADEGGLNGFRRVGENEYESRYVRVRHEMDHYHAVVTLSYRERAPEKEDGKVMLPGAEELFRKVDELERRVEAVEKENRELRKVNDMVLDLFGGLKPAHELSGVLLSEEQTSDSKTRRARAQRDEEPETEWERARSAAERTGSPSTLAEWEKGQKSSAEWKREQRAAEWEERGRSAWKEDAEEETRREREQRLAEERKREEAEKMSPARKSALINRYGR